VSLIIEIERIGNQLFEVHFGRAFAPAIAAAGPSTGTAARACATITAGSASAVATPTIVATRSTTATAAAFARWAILAALPFFFLFFCFRHC
jgi:hypothetical protein